MNALGQRVGWSAERRAQELVGRRGELLRRLPREIGAARRLRPDICELIVDDAIEFAALHHDQDVATARDLEVVFWSACVKRVHRAREGRYELVRGRFTSVGDGALETVPSAEDPVAELEAAHDRALAHEFAATLDPPERRVLKAKYDSAGSAAAGYKAIARRLGISIGAVRSAERSIERKIERFAAVYGAGRLCDMRAVAISSLAAGTADPQQARLARAHVEHCAHCRPQFATQLRELGSAAFERKVAALLPVSEIHERGLVRGSWDAIVDWVLRPFAHEPAATAAQLAASGAGRGAGTIAALKLAGACMASATAVGVCATTLVAPVFKDDPPAKTAPKKAAGGKPERPVGRHERLPTRAGQQLTPTPTPTPNAAKRRASKRDQGGAPGKTQGASGPTAHEDTPASPAPSNAAPGGESEFDPTYQPSEPPAPAPAPAAPGATEFF